MLFNSLEFILFIALFFVLWPFLRTTNTVRWVYLTAASFVFYGWWDWRFIFLIVGNGLLVYTAALLMTRLPRLKTQLLVLSIVGNLSALVVCKYLNFGISNINVALSSIGLTTQLSHASFILPVGISFYTFQSMSYTIDVYRGELKPARSIFHFFAYLAMFPQLIAGPIVRAAHLLPQLQRAIIPTEQQRWDGLQFIVRGYFKKVVIADTVAPSVERAFSGNLGESSPVFWWVVMGLFAIQIYCDFSGYSSIAQGLAKWMGYEFATNFDHPYTASSMQQFWSRWHISLSTWFRDYVYIPLGGSRSGTLLTHRNIWITMLLSGLWHGASWTFVAWGGLHAALLSFERVTRWPDRLSRVIGGRVLQTVIVLGLTLITWVFFRAESIGQAAAIVASMFNITNWDTGALSLVLDRKIVLVSAILIIREAYVYANLQTIRLPKIGFGGGAGAFSTACLIVACVFFRGPGTAFIYYQY